MQILKILESFLIYIAPYHTRQSKCLCSIYNKINDFYEKNILLIEARTCTYVVLWSEHFAVFGHIIDSDAFFRGLNKSSDLAKCLLMCDSFYIDLVFIVNSFVNVLYWNLTILIWIHPFTINLIHFRNGSRFSLRDLAISRLSGTPFPHPHYLLTIEQSSNSFKEESSFLFNWIHKVCFD